jgi:hypothetical protein
MFLFTFNFCFTNVFLHLGYVYGLNDEWPHHQHCPPPSPRRVPTPDTVKYHLTAAVTAPQQQRHHHHHQQHWQQPAGGAAAAGARDTLVCSLFLFFPLFQLPNVFLKFRSNLFFLPANSGCTVTPMKSAQTTVYRRLGHTGSLSPSTQQQRVWPPPP